MNSKYWYTINLGEKGGYVKVRKLSETEKNSFEFKRIKKELQKRTAVWNKKKLKNIRFFWTIRGTFLFLLTLNVFDPRQKIPLNDTELQWNINPNTNDYYIEIRKSYHFQKNDKNAAFHSIH